MLPPLGNMFFVALIWGVTNPFIKNGSTGIGKIKSNSIPGQIFQEIIHLIRNWRLYQSAPIGQCCHSVPIGMTVNQLTDCQPNSNTQYNYQTCEAHHLDQATTVAEFLTLLDMTSSRLISIGLPSLRVMFAQSFVLPFVISQLGSIVYSFVTLQTTQLSLAVPVTNSLTFVVTALTGWCIGEEPLNKRSTLGVLLVVMGTSLCYLDKVNVGTVQSVQS